MPGDTPATTVVDPALPAVADTERAGAFRQTRDDLVVHGSLDEQAAARDAGLAAILERPLERALNRGVEIGVGEHDVGVLTSELA
jgi:hypothetical protein